MTFLDTIGIHVSDIEKAYELDDGRILSCPMVQEHVPVKNRKEDIEK